MPPMKAIEPSMQASFRCRRRSLSRFNESQLTVGE
jgi:hypothetical protein